MHYLTKTFLGKRWQQKVKEVLESLDISKNDATVLTALDEVLEEYNEY